MNKIIEYINYLFNVNKIDDLAMKEEITSNLIAKYEDLIKDGKNEDEAYLTTIKSVGNLNIEDKKFEEKYSYKPNWANISLFIALTLAVLATIVLLLSVGFSIAFTAISISLYVGASYYLYHLSQHVLKEEKDILKHNSLLKGIFTHLKTVFVFWNINISYWLATIITNLIITPIVISSFDVVDQEVMIGMLLVQILIAIIVFIPLFIIGNGIYRNLEEKYFELTQHKELESYIQSQKIIKIHPRTKTIFVKAVYIAITLIYIFNLIFSSYDGIFLASPGYSGGSFSFSLFNHPTLNDDNLSILSYITLLGGTILFVVSLIKNKNVFKIISATLLLISDLLFFIYARARLSNVNFRLEVNIKPLFSVIYLIVLVVLIISQYKKTRKKA